MALPDWHDGRYRNAPDDTILQAAALAGRVLVTYDSNTTPSLLKVWFAAGRQHSGVILIDPRTVKPGDVGGLIGALRAAIIQTGDDDWRDVVRYLRPWGLTK